MQSELVITYLKSRSRRSIVVFNDEGYAQSWKRSDVEKGLPEGYSLAEPEVNPILVHASQHVRRLKRRQNMLEAKQKRKRS